MADVTDALRRRVVTPSRITLDQILDALIRRATDGDVDAIRLIFERLDGVAPTLVAFAPSDEEPPTIMPNYRR